MTSTSGSNEADTSVEQPAPAAKASVTDAEVSLQQFVQNFAAITASLYVVGLLTTNAYLYSLGVSDFSLLRARFVLTGLVTLLPLTIALIGGLYAADEVAAFGGGAASAARMSRWFVRHVAFPIALYFLLFSFLFWYSADNDPYVAARTAALLSAVCAIIVLALLGGLALYWLTGRHSSSDPGPRKQSRIFGQFTRWIGIPDSV